MTVSRGYLIAIEGIDAVGKSTQCRMLADWLRRNHKNTKLMAFPDYTTPIGRRIKSFLAERSSYPAQLQHLLFAANRWEKLPEILASLRRNLILVVDRYTPSNLAYGKANGLDVDWIAGLEKGMPEPNLVIVLDAPVRTLSRRRSNDKKDSYERRSSLQNKARTAYRQLALARDWTLIDARVPAGDVHTALTKSVSRALARGDFRP